MNQHAHQFAPHDAPADSFDGVRTLPQNLDAEKALLGAILVSNKAYHAVEEILTPEDFSVKQHARVFEACRSLIENGRTADPVTMKRFFESDNSLSEIGGAVYLADLAASAVTVINAREYARIVRDTHLRRRLIAFGHDLAARAQSADVDLTAGDIVEAAERGLTELVVPVHGQGRGNPEIYAEARAVVQRARDNPGRLIGVSTGLRALDRITLGLEPPLIILAGRPGQGKTALGARIARGAAEALRDGKDGGAAALFMSMEMQPEQIILRQVSDLSDVPFNFVRGGQRHRGHEDGAIAEAFDRMEALPLEWDNRGALSVAQIRSRYREFRRKHKGTKTLLVIDQLNHIRRPPSHRTTNDDIGDITRALLALGKETDSPVMCLHQLSRQSMRRADRRPMLDDLRDSGNIEQDAATVIFIHREEEYLKKEEPREDGDDHDKWERKMKAVRGTAEIIIAKQRQGETPTITMACDMAYQRIADLAYQTNQGDL